MLMSGGKFSPVLQLPVVTGTLDVGRPGLPVGNWLGVGNAVTTPPGNVWAPDGTPAAVLPEPPAPPVMPGTAGIVTLGVPEPPVPPPGCTAPGWPGAQPGTGIGP